MIIRLIEEVCGDDERVLVVAPSNTAVDEIGGRLDALGILFTRVGQEEKIRGSLRCYGLYHKAVLLAESYGTGAQSRRSYQPLTERADAWNQRVKQEFASGRGRIFRDAVKTIMNESTVVLSTLSSSLSWEVVESRKFQTIIVDEAAQASLPETLIPLHNMSLNTNSPSHFILIGGMLYESDCPAIKCVLTRSRSHADGTYCPDTSKPPEPFGLQIKLI